jgi:hypothetical protein
VLPEARGEPAHRSTVFAGVRSSRHAVRRVGPRTAPRPRMVL